MNYLFEKQVDKSLPSDGWVVWIPHEAVMADIGQGKIRH